MKKRIVSLLLALCLLAGLLPAVTPQADAVISTVIGTSLKMCTSLVKGGIYACRNGSEYDNAGQGVLAVFKYAGSDLLGIDFGGSSSGQTKETVIQKVDLSKVEAELSSISKQLEKNSAAIHQLERTVSNGIASLSQQMENLSGQIQNATLELKYSTYLNTFFEFFNQYYEALSYYDRLVTDPLRPPIRRTSTTSSTPSRMWNTAATCTLPSTSLAAICRASTSIPAPAALWTS